MNADVVRMLREDPALGFMGDRRVNLAQGAADNPAYTDNLMAFHTHLL